MNRIMIAGTGSGCGKTTMTCAILAALKNMEKNIIAFKCGPDYIDPMFHKNVTKVESRNLDIFLMGENNVCYSLQRNAECGELAIIEGVMGLYDGIGSGSISSANHVSQLTKTPVLLVVNTKGKSNSVCAEIKGYIDYKKNNICGVLLNNTPETMYPFYKKMIESDTGIKVAGFLPAVPAAHIESRHLGLVTAAEIKDMEQKISLLADKARKNIELDWIIKRASEVEAISTDDVLFKQDMKISKAKIYIAEDEAFCFSYKDNHDLLNSMGADIDFFSPLKDTELPSDADGLILWGGYPELYADVLEKNKSMRFSIKQKIESGLPVYAECGGFMYLHDKLKSHNNISYQMLGILEGKTEMTSKLQNFGYIELIAEHDNMLCKKGEKINAHSFHHSKSDYEGNGFTAIKQSNGNKYPCIVTRKNIFAGYPHIHFWSNPDFARNFIIYCSEYRRRLPNEVCNKSG